MRSSHRCLAVEWVGDDDAAVTLLSPQEGSHLEEEALEKKGIEKGWF